jgi:heat shock protein HslJ
MQYLHLTNNKGQELMTLRRQNLDFLNGPWQLKELNGENIMDKNVKVVIDIPMLTINAVTSCNVINGIVHIDPTKHYDVQFEDLQSSHYLCPDIQLETDVLIGLEETATCKAINSNEMALLDNKGNIILRLTKIDLKATRKPVRQ